MLDNSYSMLKRRVLGFVPCLTVLTVPAAIVQQAQQATQIVIVKVKGDTDPAAIVAAYGVR